MPAYMQNTSGRRHLPGRGGPSATEPLGATAAKSRKRIVTSIRSPSRGVWKGKSNSAADPHFALNKQTWVRASCKRNCRKKTGTGCASVMQPQVMPCVSGPLQRSHVHTTAVPVELPNCMTTLASRMGCLWPQLKFLLHCKSPPSRVQSSVHAGGSMYSFCPWGACS
jgi:hypothetical protein